MKNKVWILWLVSAVALVALVFYGSHKWQFNWASCGRQLMHADWWKFAIGIGLIYSAYLLRAFRWAIFLRPVKRVSPMTLLGPQVIGFSGVALLGRLADPLRPYLVARRLKLPIESQMAVYTVERMFDAGSMALIFSLVLGFAPDLKSLPHHEVISKVARGGLVGAAAMGVFAVVTVFSGETLAALADKLIGALIPSVGSWIAARIRSFSKGLNTLASFPDFLFALGTSSLMWAMIVLAYVETIWAFPESPQLSQMTLARCMVVMAIGMLGSILQAPVIGWFTTIFASAGGLRLMGVPQEPALAAGAMLLVVSFLSIIPVGLIWSRFQHISLRAVAEESEHAESKALLGES